jgi:hypothetical protein
VSTCDFTWVDLFTGYINLGDKTVPVFYTQNACPIAIYLSNKHLPDLKELADFNTVLKQF